MSDNRHTGNWWLTGDSLIAWGLALSVVAHLAGYGGYRVVKYFGWGRGHHVPELFKSVITIVEEAKKFQAEHPPQQPTEQLVFVEVDPNSAVPEPPKDTKNYSSHNSVAANPDPKIDTTVPKIDGKQTIVQKAEDVQRPKPFPLQPAPPKVAVKESTEEAKPKPKGGPPPGDLAMAKAAPKPGEGLAESDAGVAKIAAQTRPRPRRLEEVLPAQTTILGQKMKQDGGVQRNRLVPTFDAKGSTYGEYDAALVRAIVDRWYGLLDERDLAGGRTGKVVIDFRLNFNGTISDMKVVENTVDMTLEIPCRRAITDPAPYLAWPLEMRRLVKEDYREIRFTFSYY